MKRLFGWMIGCALVLGMTTPVMAQAPDLANMDIVLKSVPDGPVAKVYDRNISAQEFTGLYKAEVMALAMQAGKTEVPNEIRIGTALRCLAMLVQREILYQEALKRKLVITDQELKEGVDRELKRAREAMAGEKGKTMTDDDLLKQTGVTRTEINDQIRRELMIGKIREKIVTEKKVTVTDAEIASYFEEKKELFKRPDQCRIRQIFVRFAPEGKKADDAMKASAKERIDKALQRIKAGESFESVAKAVSDAPDRDQGGDTGLMPFTALPSFYQKAVGTLTPGQMSDIIVSDIGCHIIRLESFESGTDGTLEKSKDLIRKMLEAKKANEVVDEFCNPVMNEKGAVKVFLELERTMATDPSAAGLNQEAILGGAADAGPKAPAAKKEAPAKADTKKAAPADTKKAAPAKTDAKKAAPAKKTK